MTPKDFVGKFYGDALKCEKDTGISALATLVQAAWESGWGEAAPGNMFFGQKDSDGLNGNEQLLRTKEIFSTPDVKITGGGRRIISIKPVVVNGRKKFEYVIMDYFRKYSTPAECFTEHGKFILTTRIGGSTGPLRYAAAVAVKADPVAFIQEIARAGYATDPNYAKSLIGILGTIKKNIPK